MPNAALILYYSRSQNTTQLAKAAEAAIAACGWQVIRMPLARAVKAFPEVDPSLVVLGVPVHYWTVPAAAMELIQNLPAMNGSHAFVYSCYGGCVTNNVPFTLAQEMTAKGARVIGGAQFLAPHSIRNAGGRRLGEEEERFGKGHPTGKALAEFADALTRAARAIETRSARPVNQDLLKINTMGFISGVMDAVSPLKMKRAFMPPVTVNPSACDGCHACSSVCDTGSIKHEGAGIVRIDQKTCYRCYGCIEVCPNNALTTNWKQAEWLVRSMKWIVRDAESLIVL